MTHDTETVVIPQTSEPSKVERITAADIPTAARRRTGISITTATSPPPTKR